MKILAWYFVGMSSFYLLWCLCRWGVNALYCKETQRCNVSEPKKKKQEKKGGEVSFIN